MKAQTFGAEVEKVISDKKTGHPHKLSQNFFKLLEKEAKKRKTFLSLHKSDIKKDVVLGVASKDLGEQGLDNGFNLQETSLAYQHSLSELFEKMNLDLSTVVKAAEAEEASLVNLSIHPLGRRDQKTYGQLVAPKGVYKVILERGWDHSAGIDARAQNSPTTGISIHNAADAVSVIIGAGAAFVGLFANSPFEEGKLSKYKEARQTMWIRMMKNSKIPGDRIISQFPKRRFNTLASYFNWMFGGQTALPFVLLEQKGNDYKGIGERILMVNGNPSILSFLSKPMWEASYFTKTSEKITVTPSISHLEAAQFMQFSGARIRFKLKNHASFPINDFLKACEKENEQKVESIFSRFIEYSYIEGRDPGSNLPDSELFDAGRKIASSTIISPSALQAGLLQNLKEAVSYIDSFEWTHLKKLKDAAIQYGLHGSVDGTSVYEFSKRIFDIAARGLDKSEQKFLTYPEYVLQTKKTGADRALDFVEKQKGSTEKSIEQLVRKRAVVLQ